MGSLGNPHFFTRNGLGLPSLGQRSNVGMGNFSYQEESKENLEGSPPSLFWAIWKERNRIIFENECFSSSRLKHSFINYLFAWVGLIYEGDHSIVRLLSLIH